MTWPHNHFCQCTVCTPPSGITDPSRDRIAHTIMCYSWSANDMKDMKSPLEGYGLADRILAALGITEHESI